MDNNHSKSKQTMKKIYKIFVASIVLISFASCIRFFNWEVFAHWSRYDAYHPDSTKLIGTWMAEDSAIIVLNNDGTCSLQNVQRVISYSGHSKENDTSKVWNFNGQWYIKPKLSYSSNKDTVGYILHLDNRQQNRKQFNEGEYDLELRIHNEKVSKEIVPTLLYDFIGDPDQFDLYAFYRQE